MISEPFVSVLTPVYNGDRYLAECIESVLGQDYTNWEYVIVNNCSTDGTLALAESYAARDNRIRVATNEKFVGVVENHNNAFRQMSAQSVYCKVLCADDLLLPQALGKMVRFAVQNPTVGIVGSYQQSGERIRYKGLPGLPEDVTLLSGREVCRIVLLQGTGLFGAPTGTLYRSDLVRRTDPFFPHDEPHADTSACYASLLDCDFGFIHEVLTFERVHEEQLSARCRRLDTTCYADLETLMRYGPYYLTEAELAERRKECLTEYYRVLGAGLLKLKWREFWVFHEAKLRSLGEALNPRRVLMEAVHRFFEELREPKAALRKFKSALAERIALRN
jgi:glycosyltransferase involved in cell wall biosynthesis